jgi:VanZ family protein
MSSRQVGLWGPVALVAGTIFYFSHLPSPPSPPGAPDWLLHGLAYGLLGFVLARALAGGWGLPIRRRAGLLTVALGVAYGISDELHQSFIPGRDPSLSDVTADTVGTLAGLGAAMAVFSLLPGSTRMKSR